MSKNILTDLDLNNNEIKNMRVHSLSSAPSNAKIGQIYYNTADKSLYQFNGTTWIPIDREVEVGDTAPTDISKIWVDTSESSESNIISEALPIGTIIPYPSSIIPEGFLECNGQAVSRTTYSSLFNIIGTTFGSGDGSTTFNLPNIQGRVLVGLNSNDSNFNSVGKTGRRKDSYTHS